MRQVYFKDSQPDQLRLATTYKGPVCNIWKPVSLYRGNQCIISIATTLRTSTLTAFQGFFVADCDNLWRLKHEQRHWLWITCCSWSFSSEEMWKHKNTRGSRFWRFLKQEISLFCKFLSFNSQTAVPMFRGENTQQSRQHFTRGASDDIAGLLSNTWCHYELIGCWNKWCALRSKTGLWGLDKLSCRLIQSETLFFELNANT